MHDFDNSTNKNYRLDIIVVDMIKGLVKYWYLLLILLISGAGIGFCYGKMTYIPIYKATTTFSVKTSTTTSTNDLEADYNFTYDSMTASQIADTFPYLIDNDFIVDKMKDDLGVDNINGTITANVIENSNFVTLTVLSSKSQDALSILNAFINHFPELAKYVLGNTELTILMKPEVTSEPVNNDSSKKNIEKGLLAGLAFFVMFVFVYAVSRNTIRQKKDFEEKLNLYCLGLLPHVSFKRNSGMVNKSVLLTNPSISKEYIENLRILRTSFLNDLKENTIDKVILITSAVPEEGKTITAINFAYSLAQTGKKVCLVDADLRSQSISKMLNKNESTGGMLEIIKKENTLKNTIVKSENTSLYIIAGEKTEKNPTNLLTTSVTANFIHNLSEKFDYVILDTPPCDILVDTSILAKYADCAIFVIAQDRARVGQIINGIENLSFSNIRILGGVFNNVKKGAAGYGYGNGYGYNYGYDYSYGDEHNDKSNYIRHL